MSKATAKALLIVLAALWLLAGVHWQAGPVTVSALRLVLGCEVMALAVIGAGIWRALEWAR